MFGDETGFHPGHRQLVVDLEEDFLSQGEVCELFLGEVRLDGQVVPGAEVSERMTGLSDVLADVDLSVGKGDPVDDIAVFAHEEAVSLAVDESSKTGDGHPAVFLKATDARRYPYGLTKETGYTPDFKAFLVLRRSGPLGPALTETEVIMTKSKMTIAGLMLSAAILATSPAVAEGPDFTRMHELCSTNKYGCITPAPGSIPIQISIRDLAEALKTTLSKPRQSNFTPELLIQFNH